MIRRPHPGGSRIVSRSDNPFATCWTRPTAVGWRSIRGIDVAQLVAKFDCHGGGQIVGPHGAGKTTLLRALGRALAARGERVCWWVWRDGRPPRERCPVTHSQDVLLVDGYEQLSMAARLGLRWRCMHVGAKLVVTTHQKARMNVLAELAPTPEDVLDLFRQLTVDRPTAVSEAAVAASYDRQGGNVRDIWFDLYDLHHRLQTQR